LRTTVVVDDAVRAASFELKWGFLNGRGVSAKLSLSTSG